MFNVLTDIDNLELFSLLHAALVPTGHSKRKDDKKIWKYSIADSQSSFFIKARNLTDLKIAIEKQQSTYSSFGISYQPRTVILTDDNNRIQYYSVYQDIYYKFDTLAHALSSTFKLHYVFNLEYQVECAQVWQFIQEYFFEIKSTTKSSTALLAFLSYLNN